MDIARTTNSSVRDLNTLASTITCTVLRIHVDILKFRAKVGGAASWGGVAVDAGYVDAFLAAAITRVMRAAVPIPAVAAAFVLHSAAVGGSVVGVVRPL